MGNWGHWPLSVEMVHPTYNWVFFVKTGRHFNSFPPGKGFTPFLSTRFSPSIWRSFLCKKNVSNEVSIMQMYASCDWWRNIFLFFFPMFFLVTLVTTQTVLEPSKNVQDFWKNRMFFWVKYGNHDYYPGFQSRLSLGGLEASDIFTLFDPSW